MFPAAFSLPEPLPKAGIPSAPQAPEITRYLAPFPPACWPILGRIAGGRFRPILAVSEPFMVQCFDRLNITTNGE
jgi:hypothetical protein